MLHLAAAAAVFALGTWLRARHLGGPDLGFDEFYHVFAAKSLLAGGGLEVAEGRPYERASLVTFLTAASFALFGESEATARLPALVCGLALMALVYAAGCALFGRAAGLVALALTALSPDLIDVARFARLYSPLALTTLATALAAFLGLEAALRPPGRARAAAAWLLVAAVAGAVALHLHPAALGLGPTVLAYVALVAVGLAASRRRREAARYAAVAAALAATAVVLVALPAVRAAIRASALTPLDWYAEEPAGPAAYHYYLAWQYGWLWYLVWPSAVVAALVRPRAGVFVGLAFWVPFVAISAAVATRAPRYVVHLLPFAFLLVGAAAGVAFTAGRAALAVRLSAWLPGEATRQRALRAALAAAVAIGAIVPPLYLSPSVAAAMGRPSRRVGALATGHFFGWREAAPAIRPHLHADTVVVSGVPLASRYYFGRPAVRLLAAGRTRQLWTDAGRMVVQHAADLEALRARRGALVVVVEGWRWASPGNLDGGLRSALERTCDPVPLPPDTGLAAFRCAGAARR